MPAYEYNFDGLPGPTHNFAGLSFGNLASKRNRFVASNPKMAALQSLEKMRLLFDLGIPQGIIPPQNRPDIEFLRQQGATGSDAKIIESLIKSNREMLLISYSASAMWMANAATVSPSVDCENKKMHMTTANLVTQRHRSIEAEQTFYILQNVFENKSFFVMHPPLPNDGVLFDEGGANHMRMCESYESPGIEVFVYGKNGGTVPKKFPARQSKQASETIALTHGLAEEKSVFAQQNPISIDKGVFHNDVIAVSNENVLLYHEEAFVDTKAVIKDIKQKYKKVSKNPLHLIKVDNKQLSVDECVQTYFFNSQIITKSNKKMVLIAPEECRQNMTRKLIDKIIAGKNPIEDVIFVDLRESMKNGGGPACLRLRVVLNEVEQSQVHQGCILTEELFKNLEYWIERNYRQKLDINDLGDPQLLKESHKALDELTQILDLGSIYNFQKI